VPVGKEEKRKILYVRKKGEKSAVGGDTADHSGRISLNGKEKVATISSTKEERCASRQGRRGGKGKDHLHLSTRGFFISGCAKKGGRRGMLMVVKKKESTREGGKKKEIHTMTTLGPPCLIGGRTNLTPGGKKISIEEGE